MRRTPGGPSGPSGKPQTDAQRRARGALPLRGVTLPPELAALVRARLGAEPWARGALSELVRRLVRSGLDSPRD